MISIALVLFIALAACIRFKNALLLFVFLLPFMPRYLGVAVGSGSISARRMAIWILLVGFLLWAIRNRQGAQIRSVVRCGSSLLQILGALFAIKIFATLISSSWTNLAYVADEFLFSVPILIIIGSLIQTDRDRLKILAVMILGLLVCELIAVVEYLRQTPILSGLVDVSVYNSARALEGRYRDGFYRAMALFDNPLLLAEFGCLIWPIGWACWRLPKRRWSVIARLSLLMLPPLLYFVGARSGWLVFVSTIAFLMVASMWSRTHFLIKPIVVGLLMLALLALAAYASAIFLNPSLMFDATEEGGRSALERIQQYYVVFEGVKAHPLIGFGAQQNYANDLDFLNNLDNYWLRLLLESGFLGLILTLLFLTMLWRFTRFIASRARHSFDKRLIVALTAVLVSFFLFKLFLSIPSNNVYLYVVAGILVGWSCNLKALRGQNARVADPQFI